MNYRLERFLKYASEHEVQFEECHRVKGQLHVDYCVLNECHKCNVRDECNGANRFLYETDINYIKRNYPEFFI